ncbi:MAG: hypothetical protein LBD29_10475 [Treponema sp.]|nr:hypothetical protein [Treponema sp.]
MIKRHIQNQVKFTYILANLRYSSAGNMRFTAKRDKVFIFELKENRRTADSEKKGLQGVREAGSIESTGGAACGRLDKGFRVSGGIVFRNKDGTGGGAFWRQMI